MVLGTTTPLVLAPAPAPPLLRAAPSLSVSSDAVNAVRTRCIVRQSWYDELANNVSCASKLMDDHELRADKATPRGDNLITR